MGHGWGLDHPVGSNGQYLHRWHGQPRIMVAKGTEVDKPYQRANNSLPNLEPALRKATQQDIFMLRLDKLNYVNGKANLGKLTNDY
jgi:hypothetical protein